MRIGLQVYLAGDAATPAFLTAMAKGLEERGFHAVWLAEHVILPPVIGSRYPYNPEGRFPADTRNLPLEPFTALAFVAAQTRALRLGTGVSVLPQRNPVFMAKQVADVDVLSGGRVDYGIGAGWCLEEIERLGVPPERRGARTDDYIRLMKAIWTEETIRHEGPFYRLAESHSSPKPVQKPHPPLFIGGNSEAALRRVARLGDGWFAAALAPAQYAEAVSRLHAVCARQGRDPAGVRLIVAPPDGKASLDMVKGYRAAGAEQVIVSIGSRAIERFLARLDGLAEELVVPAAAL